MAAIINVKYRCLHSFRVMTATESDAHFRIVLIRQFSKAWIVCFTLVFGWILTLCAKRTFPFQGKYEFRLTFFEYKRLIRVLVNFPYAPLKLSPVSTTGNFGVHYGTNFFVRITFSFLFKTMAYPPFYYYDLFFYLLYRLLIRLVVRAKQKCINSVCIDAVNCQVLWFLA